MATSSPTSYPTASPTVNYDDTVAEYILFASVFLLLLPGLILSLTVCWPCRYRLVEIFTEKPLIRTFRCCEMFGAVLVALGLILVYIAIILYDNEFLIIVSFLLLPCFIFAGYISYREEQEYSKMHPDTYVEKSLGFQVVLAQPGPKDLNPNEFGSFESFENNNGRGKSDEKTPLMA